MLVLCLHWIISAINADECSDVAAVWMTEVGDMVECAEESGSVPLCGAPLSLYSVTLPLSDDLSHGSELDSDEDHGVNSGVTVMCGECGMSTASTDLSVWTLLNLPPDPSSGCTDVGTEILELVDRWSWTWLILICLWVRPKGFLRLIG